MFALSGLGVATMCREWTGVDWTEKFIGMARGQELLEKRERSVFSKTSKFNHDFFTEHCHKEAELHNQKTKNIIRDTSHISENNMAFLILWKKLWRYILHIQAYCTISMNRQNHQVIQPLPIHVR